MKAYKFRSTENYDYLLDIIVNNRLYCADHKDLNDVFEADIRVGRDIGREVEFMRKMRHFNELLRSYRICSLTKGFDNPLLWAYYASGFTGIAIELELPDDHKQVYEIEYSDEFDFFSDFIDDYENPAQIVRPLLRKRISWKHEKEIRILSKDRYFDIKGMITGVIIGPRMNHTAQKGLYDICAKMNISLYRAVVADWGIYTVGYQKIGE